MSLFFLTTPAFSLCNLSNLTEAISNSKKAIKVNRNDMKAHACLVIAYEISGNSYMAFKVLRDIEDKMSKECIDELHNYLWDISPELLAKKEFTDRYTLSGGDCMIKNTSMIDGYGYLLIGDFLNPSNNTISRHLASFKCNKDFSKCKSSNLVCPECVIVKPELVIKVIDYKIVDLFTINHSPMEKNLRYIKKILQMQREIYAR
ncbi:MAG TPA: hypothetical protein HPP56_02265 [Nitrospirae bacterium]|nr:hypothetical protein [Nitrospirota bacterium]